MKHGSKHTVPAGAGLLTQGVVFTKQQLQYFGCQEPKKLEDLQMEAMMVSKRLIVSVASAVVCFTHLQ